MSNKYYRTKDGQADYKFSFEKESSSNWRAYILSQPSYRGRAEDADSTHRLTNKGRKYICWTDRLKTQEQAESVASVWADYTQDYIRTGNKFGGRL
jgi:hypothetical protein